MREIIYKFKEYARNGFIHSFSASVINKVVMFFSSVIIARRLSKQDYGILSVTNNIFSIAILFAGLGIGSGLVQFCAENRDTNEKVRIYKYANTTGLITCIIIAIIMAFYGYNNLNAISESNHFILWSCLLPTFYFLYNNETLYLRAHKRIKEYTRTINCNSICYALFSLIFGKIWGIGGVIFGRYLAYIVSFIIGYFFVKISPFSYAIKHIISDETKKELWSYSIMCGIASAINQLVYLIDVNMISNMIKDASSVAVYKVATLIPENLSIIPGSLLIVVIPDFAMHLGDKRWVSRNTKKIFTVLGFVNFVIVGILIVFAPIIIGLIWGSDYSESIVPFRILSLNYFLLGTFRLTSTQILASQRKAKTNMIISIGTLIANVVFNYIFIKQWGINGAAYATIAVVFLACLLQMPEMNRIMNSN